jgi:uncharacterized membrane protein
MTPDQDKFSKTPLTRTQNISRILLGLMLLVTGTGHLTWARAKFTAQVPNWLPMNDDLVVVLSGIAELTLGLSLILLVRFRVFTGWMTALFFVAIFPGNIAQFVNHTDSFGLNSDLARGLRLLFQPVFILWALWSTGAWQAWKQRNKSRV